MTANHLYPSCVGSWLVRPWGERRYTRVNDSYTSKQGALDWIRPRRCGKGRSRWRTWPRSKGLGRPTRRSSTGPGLELLRRCSTRGQPRRQEGAGREGGHFRALDPKWVNHADLFRIKGVAGEYAELLEAAGVDTVVELAQRNATNLQAKMFELNEAEPLVRRVPSESEVQGWVEEAKTLPRRVSY